MARTDSRGISWAAGATPGRTIPLRDFFVAEPSDSVAKLHAALARGMNLLLTPGVYVVARSIAVKRAHTVVLGIGRATLTAVRGAVPLTIADVPGVVVAGVTIDAGSVEGFSGDAERWNTKLGRNGVVVNGDDVTATGLFVEHFQQYSTVWNGEDGTTILYQNELPYDPPSQADWTHDGIEGWAAYKVADDVKRHHLYGGGAYVFNRNDPSIHTENGFEVPQTPGVQLHHIMTVNLGAGTIDHVVNGVGDAADVTKIGVPVYIVDYP